MPDDLSIPRLPRKQIELWDTTSTSGNFRPYQIQTANIHFKTDETSYMLNRETTNEFYNFLYQPLRVDLNNVKVPNTY